ncbi:hypothetical protein LXL04_011489 [Taraxacum kok-saghyz]
MTFIGMAFFSNDFMPQASHKDDLHSPIFQTCTTSHDFHGIASLLGKRSMSYATELFDQETNTCEDELLDDGLLEGEKKRRSLKLEQVKTLERNFELGSKLDQERKMQLARELELQPRQVAIWFQNRRARWKTKQLEKDYDVLKSQFEAVKAQNDSLLSQNHKLHAQIMAIKNKDSSINLKVKETEGSCSNRIENSSEMIAHDHHHYQRNPNLLPPSIVDRSHQLFHNLSASTSADRHHQHHHYHLHGQKINQLVAMKEEGLSNMFVGVDDQSGFWPWLEQQRQP